MRKSILCFAMATKNHCEDKNLLFNLIQQVMQTSSLKDMARSPREKQRGREVFEGVSAGYRGLIENPVFANPFVSGTFTAQKKASRVTG